MTKPHIRQWRTHRVLSLEQLAARVGLTHASLSRVERGLQPYNQDMLEALAIALGTDVVSLLIRNPTDPEITLQFIAEQLDQLLAELREMNAELRETVAEMKRDRLRRLERAKD